MKHAQIGEQPLISRRDVRNLGWRALWNGRLADLSPRTARKVVKIFRKVENYENAQGDSTTLQVARIALGNGKIQSRGWIAKKMDATVLVVVEAALVPMTALLASGFLKVKDWIIDYSSLATNAKLLFGLIVVAGAIDIAYVGYNLIRKYRQARKLVAEARDSVVSDVKLCLQSLPLREQ